MAYEPSSPSAGLPTDPKLEWPPAEGKVNEDAYLRWGAWYAGDTDRLSQAYINHVSTAGRLASAGMHRSHLPFAATSRERMFWGRTGVSDVALQAPRLHIPLPADIAATSADLLFGEMPSFFVADETPPKAKQPGRFTRAAAKLGLIAGPPTTPDGTEVDDGGTGGQPTATPQRRSHKPTQDWVDETVETQGLQAVLLEGAELCSSYGGIYLRIVWDKTIADRPFLDAITPDRAVPEWRFRRLSAVTFWKTLGGSEQEGTVWRHLERHEPGRILHGLYKGTGDKLGDAQQLIAHPETAPFQSLGLDANGALRTGSEGLTAEYIPNIAPDRDCPGSPYGRSDYAGIDGTLDALDEAWTSWMRDLRLGKGRLIVPDDMVQNLGRGKGSVFDLDQELYQQVTALQSQGSLSDSIKEVQFEIRVEQHSATCAALTAVALRGAGYSAQTFGQDDDGIAATATEINAREARSFKTRARKIGYWAPAVRRLMAVMIEVAIEHFDPDGIKPIRPQVEWPDGVGRDPEAIGKAVQLYAAARAASTYTLVKMVNPDWVDDQIREEVDRIRADQQAMMPPLDLPGQGSDGPLDGGDDKPPAAKPKPASGSKE